MIAKKELEKFQSLYHQNLSSIKALEELNKILSKKRSPWLKTSLGYEEGSSSKQSECEHTVQTKAIETSTRIRNLTIIINQRLLMQHPSPPRPRNHSVSEPHYKYQL